MKKLFKRTLAMVLTVALCVSMLQLTAFAAELDPVTPDAEEVIHDHDHSDAEEVTTAENGDGAEGEQENQPLGADVETFVSTSDPADGEENPGTDTEEPSDEEEAETDVEEASVEEEPEADVEETSGEEEVKGKASLFLMSRGVDPSECKGKHSFYFDETRNLLICSNCGITCSQITESGEHKFEKEVVKATCEEDGYLKFYCDSCGTHWIKEEYKAIGHQWDNGIVTKEPTCNSAGEMTYTCKNDKSHTKTEEIPATGKHIHTHEEIEEATCTKPGTIKVICDDCGKVLEEKELPKLKHEYVDGKCKYCGKCVDFDEASGHHKETFKTEHKPTCTEAGYIEYSKCPYCGFTLDNVPTDPATGHDWDEGTVIEKPSMTGLGVIRYVCKNDPTHVKTEPVCTQSVDGKHKLEKVIVDPTCTQKGYIIYKCDSCGFEEIVDDKDANGHKWKSEIIIPATCKDEGLQRFYCEVCDADLGTRIILKNYANHICYKDGELDPDAVLKKGNETIPTCAVKGNIEWLCPGCDAVVKNDEVAIDPNNHVGYSDFVWSEWVDNEDGLTQTRTGVSTCEGCNDTKTETETRTVNAYYTVEVYTVDANGNATLSRTETLKDRIGETVSTSGQVLAGYTLDGTRSTLSATLAESGTVLRVYYNANPTPPVTPGTTDDDDDDDDDDDEPYTPPTIVVPDEPAPLTPTPVGPVAPAAPVAPVTPVTPPTVEVEDPQVPLAENPGLVAGPLAEAGDDEVPLAVRAGWSLVNLLLTIFTALAAAWQLISRKKKDENEDEENTQNAQTTEEEDQDNRRSRLRLLSLVPAVGSVLLFIFNENLRNPMILVNRLTVVMVMIAAVQVALMVLTAQSEDDEDDRQEAARA